MLIDNVGLHRIFGLPVRDRDWEAMFEGRMEGNAQPRTRMENNGLSVSCSLSEDSKRNEGLEIVMTHARLLDAVRNGDLICLGGGGPVGEEQWTVLKAFHDRQSGNGRRQGIRAAGAAGMAAAAHRRRAVRQLSSKVPLQRRDGGGAEGGLPLCGNGQRRDAVPRPDPRANPHFV